MVKSKLSRRQTKGKLNDMNWESQREIYIHIQLEDKHNKIFPKESPLA